MVNVGQIDIFNAKNLSSENSQDVLQRVIKARQIQQQRYEKEEGMENLPKINSKISTKILEKFCDLDEECQHILQLSVEKMQSSMRGINRILKVARTIADLENCEKISKLHLLEAISYRRKI